MNLRKLPWIPIALGAGVVLFTLSKRSKASPSTPAPLPAGVPTPGVPTPATPMSPATQAYYRDLQRYMNAIRPGPPPPPRVPTSPVPPGGTCPFGGVWLPDTDPRAQAAAGQWLYDKNTGQRGKCVDI